MLKCWNQSITTRNNAVTYAQTPRGGSLTTSADKNQKCQKFSKSLKKIAKKYKYAFLATGCSSVASHGGGGGGGGGLLGTDWAFNTGMGG